MMTEKRFTELYTDAQFSAYIGKMLARFYRQYKSTFDDNAIDLDDISQECWASLYESADDLKDKNYYSICIRNATIDLLKSLNTELSIQFEE